MATLRDMKFLFSCWKILNMLAVLTHEIFFNSPRGHVHVISFIHARVQPQSFHLNGNTIGFHPQIQKLKWEFTLLQVRWVSLHVGVSVIMHSFTVKIDLNYQGTCKWLFIWLWLGAWYLSTAKCFKHKKYLYKKSALRTAV